MTQEKQILFLKECLRYVDAAERHKLEETILRLRRNECCVCRALSLMLVHGALAFAGLGYCAVFLSDSQDLQGLMTHFVFRMFCALVLVPVICVPVFLSIASRYRRKLNQQGEECLKLVTELLETRLGMPIHAPNPKATVEERERERAVSSRDGEPIPSIARVDCADQTASAVG